MNLCFFLFLINPIVSNIPDTQRIYLPELCQPSSYCDNNEPCSKNGNCYVDIFKYFNVTEPNSTSSCQCNKGWKTTVNDAAKCCYKMKLQSVAFLLEFAIGFGTGHFYTGNFIRAIVKFSSNFIQWLVFCVTGFLSCYKEGNYDLAGKKKKITSNTGKYYSFLIYGSLFSFFLWQGIDSVLFGLNFYTDGEGHELDSW